MESPIDFSLRVPIDCGTRLWSGSTGTVGYWTIVYLGADIMWCKIVGQSSRSVVPGHISKRFVEDGSFVKLKGRSLSYNFRQLGFS